MDETKLDNSFEPVATIQINDAEALKLLADPLRSRMLDLLRTQVQTAKELAQTLKLSPKKLYYHLKLLEERGLIRVVGTRVVSGIIEKSYRATAYLFLFDDDVFRSTDSAESPLPPGLQAIFETTRIQLEQSVAAGTVELGDNAKVLQRLLWMWGLQRLSGQQAQEFYRRFEQLISEFHSSQPEPNADEYQDFRLFIAFFPVKAFLPSPKKAE
jgi:DNA-binding transcriptional ArsR family regulator